MSSRKRQHEDDDEEQQSSRRPRLDSHSTASGTFLFPTWPNLRDSLLSAYETFLDELDDASDRMRLFFYFIRLSSF